MAIRRTYGQGCGTAHALDLVGDRWALLVVRELVLGPKRFTDLREGLGAIGPNVLSQRLKELEEAGVIRQRVLPPPAASTVYELTEWGSELDDIVVRLARWGARDPALPRGVEMHPEWLELGMRAIYEPDDEAEPRLSELRSGDGVRGARVGDGRMTVGRGEAADPDVVIAAGPESIAKLIRGELKPATALRSGSATIEGDRAAFNRFPSLF